MHVCGKSFDDAEPFVSTNKLTGRSRGLPESNLVKSVVVDKERANNVAKIKVVVCITLSFRYYLNGAMIHCFSIGSVANARF